MTNFFWKDWYVYSLGAFFNSVPKLGWSTELLNLLRKKSTTVFCLAVGETFLIEWWVLSKWWFMGEIWKGFVFEVFVPNLKSSWGLITLAAIAKGESRNVKSSDWLVGCFESANLSFILLPPIYGNMRLEAAPALLPPGLSPWLF